MTDIISNLFDADGRHMDWTLARGHRHCLCVDDDLQQFFMFAQTKPLRLDRFNVVCARSQSVLKNTSNVSDEFAGHELKEHKYKRATFKF